MIQRIVSGVRARLVRWQRHSRLRVAIVGCLVVMFLLAALLMISVRHISSSVTRDIANAEELISAADDARDAALLLENWRGTSESRGEVIASLDQMNTHVVRLNTEGSMPLSVALSHLARTAGELVDGSHEGSFAITTDARRLAVELTEISEALADAGRRESSSAASVINAWAAGIQAVAVAAVFVFVLVVATQILPLLMSIQRSMGKLGDWNERSVVESRRRKLTRDVVEGLEVVVDEPAAYAVIERALAAVAPGRRAEMMLADSSQAHMHASVVHPDAGAAGCGVVSPWSCPAVRRGTTQTFDDSQAVRACPHLSKHDTPCSAVCAPMTFMGEPMGVLHVVGPVGEMPDDELVRDISMLAAESATRLGTLRAFARTELQAMTDVATGLPNRRATEEKLRQLLMRPDGGAAAVVEVTGIPALNDRLGRSAGDRALKVAAEALTDTVRGVDWCGRWTETEFVVVLPSMGAAQSRLIVERIGSALAERLVAAECDGLEVLVGIADRRRASTAHGMLGLIGDAMNNARGEGDFSEVAHPAFENPVEEEEILAGPQLSTP